jgi:hypothetical protein
MTAFPALVPSSRTFTPGEYPATAFSGFSGAQNRVRHSNVFLAAQLRLTFLGLTQAQMLDIWNHYNGRRGEFRPFALPTDVVSYGSITDYVPGNYLWRYAGPGSIEDLPCGGHNVSITLETVPPIAASVVGADLFLRLRLSAGVADGGEYAPGISEVITLAVAGGVALAVLNGIDQVIGVSISTESAVGDAEVNGISETLYLGFAMQGAANTGALGIDEEITLGLVAGAADNGAPEPNIGDAYGGGYFAGYISHTADGVATHRLIVAPRATGATGTGYTQTTMLAWKIIDSATVGSDSTFDGAANTTDLIDAGISDHPAAEFCSNLDINGFTDWYLPSTAELDIAYFNLKPTTQGNITNQGANNYSVPKRTANYTTGNPAQTAVPGFQSGGSEAFVNDVHWSSREFFAYTFSIGQAILPASRVLGRRVRAFRREAI